MATVIGYVKLIFFVMSYYTFSPINSVQENKCYLAWSFTRVRNIPNQNKTRTLQS